MRRNNPPGGAAGNSAGNSAGGAGSGHLAERLFVWSVLAFVAAALLLLLARPDAVLGEGPPGLARALAHLLTLGGLLGGYYPLQKGAWRKLYGREPVLPFLVWPVLAFHVVGVVLLGWGFFSGSTLIAHLGGHYLVPTAIVLFFLQGLATMARRAPGTSRHLAAHLPGLGLLVTMGLGALLVMDAYTGQYGIYTVQMILVHMLAGGFLFFLPLMLLREALEGPDAPDSLDSPPAAAAQADLSRTVVLLPPAGLAGLGVLAVALAGSGEAQAWVRPAGLALLGGVALWIGLPAFGPRRRASLRAARRSVWGALGLLLLFAAIRAWRGVGAGEAQVLLGAGVVLFLFGVALPEMLNRLASEFSQRAGRAGAGDEGNDAAELATRAEVLQYTVLLLGAGFILAGLLGEVPNLARVGAVLWGLCLGWQAGVLAGFSRARSKGRVQEPGAAGNQERS